GVELLVIRRQALGGGAGRVRRGRLTLELYGAETAEGAARDLAQPRQQEEDRLGPRMLVGERKSHRSSPQVIGQSLDQPARSMRAEAAAQRRRSELLPARTKDLRPLGEILGPGAR